MTILVDHIYDFAMSYPRRGEYGRFYDTARHCTFSMGREDRYFLSGSYTLAIDLKDSS